MSAAAANTNPAAINGNGGSGVKVEGKKGGRDLYWVRTGAVLPRLGVVTITKLIIDGLRDIDMRNKYNAGGRDKT